MRTTSFSPSYIALCLALALWSGGCLHAEDRPVLLWAQELAAAGQTSSLQKLAGRAGAGLKGKALAAAAAAKLRVRVDFFLPNDSGLPAERYFAVGAEKDRRFPWERILMVEAAPGKGAIGSGRFQVRAVVSGLQPLIDAKDPAAETLPLRLYRMFCNDLDDSEDQYVTAFKHLYGEAKFDNAGLVREPDGLRVELKRLPGSGGGPAVFLSEPLDVAKQDALNPAAHPAPPSFAAFDSDAWFAQKHKEEGDEEPDGWAFAQAMKKAGFVSAGLAHPWPARFYPVESASYQFALALEDPQVLNLRHPCRDFEGPLEDGVRSALGALPETLRVGEARKYMKNLGASRVLGRPVCNGAFLVSTGVQKLVATAWAPVLNGDRRWRFAGLAHATDGCMDQVLVRAPAHVFLFSGHGYTTSVEGLPVALFNTCAKTNGAAFEQNYLYQVFATPRLPRPGDWRDLDCGSAPENCIELVEKWKREELNLRWLIVVGCQNLDRSGSPFRSSSSSAGAMGDAVIHRAGAKGVLGFSDHGFSGASFLRRFVEKSQAESVASAWRGIFRDDFAKAYTWYERNEEYGQSRQYTYANSLSSKVPAYLVRSEALAERLTPDEVVPVAKGETVEFCTDFAGRPVRESGSYSR